MKAALFLIVFAVFGFSAAAQDNQDYAKLQRKTEGIKTICEKHYARYRNIFKRCAYFCLSCIPDTKYRCRLGCRTVYYYDEKGFLICQKSYDNWATIRSTINYEYKISDTLIEVRTSSTGFDDPESVSIDRIYYDNEGFC